MTPAARFDGLLNAWRAVETLPARSRDRLQNAIATGLLEALSAMPSDERVGAVHRMVIEEAQAAQRERIRRAPSEGLRELGLEVESSAGAASIPADSTHKEGL